MNFLTANQKESARFQLKSGTFLMCCLYKIDATLFFEKSAQNKAFSNFFSKNDPRIKSPRVICSIFMCFQNRCHALLQSMNCDSLSISVLIFSNPLLEFIPHPCADDWFVFRTDHGSVVVISCHFPYIQGVVVSLFLEHAFILIRPLFCHFIKSKYRKHP